jgi:hypothetical protein
VNIEQAKEKEPMSLVKLGKKIGPYILSLAIKNGPRFTASQSISDRTGFLQDGVSGEKKVPPRIKIMEKNGQRSARKTGTSSADLKSTPNIQTLQKIVLFLRIHLQRKS